MQKRRGVIDAGWRHFATVCSQASCKPKVASNPGHPGCNSRCRLAMQKRRSVIDAGWRQLATVCSQASCKPKVASNPGHPGRFPSVMPRFSRKTLLSLTLCRQLDMKRGQSPNIGNMRHCGRFILGCWSSLGDLVDVVLMRGRVDQPSSQPRLFRQKVCLVSHNVATRLVRPLFVAR